jgi:hypothetical protein
LAKNRHPALEEWMKQFRVKFRVIRHSGFWDEEKVDRTLYRIVHKGSALQFDVKADNWIEAFKALYNRTRQSSEDKIVRQLGRHCCAELAKCFENEEA